MDEANLKQEEREKGGGKKAGILILVVAILVLIGFNIYLLVFRKPAALEPAPVETTEETRGVVINQDNVEEVLEGMTGEAYVPPGYYTVTMNYEWYFPTTDLPSEDAYVENVAGNTNDVYFDLFLAEDEENAIYQSPIIPRGSHLDGFALDTPLAAGTYNCVVVYHLVDEKQKTISTVRVTVTVLVGE